jgi:hypothetical protein
MNINLQNFISATGKDSSYENFLFVIASNKQIETHECYNLTQNSIIDFKRYIIKINLQYTAENVTFTLKAKMNTS